MDFWDQHLRYCSFLGLNPLLQAGWLGWMRRICDASATVARGKWREIQGLDFVYTIMSHANQVQAQLPSTGDPLAHRSSDDRAKRVPLTLISKPHWLSQSIFIVHPRPLRIHEIWEAWSRHGINNSLWHLCKNCNKTLHVSAQLSLGCSVPSLRRRLAALGGSYLGANSTRSTMWTTYISRVQTASQLRLALPAKVISGQYAAKHGSFNSDVKQVWVAVGSVRVQNAAPLKPRRQLDHLP